MGVNGPAACSSVDSTAPELRQPASDADVFVPACDSTEVDTYHVTFVSITSIVFVFLVILLEKRWNGKVMVQEVQRHMRMQNVRQQQLQGKSGKRAIVLACGCGKARENDTRTSCGYQCKKSQCHRLQDASTKCRGLIILEWDKPLAYAGQCLYP